MRILDALRQQGLPIPQNAKNPTKPTKFEIDCPKDYCQENRKTAGAAAKTPLLVDIVSSKYATWTCRHCLWSGHIGEKPPALDMPFDQEEPAQKPAQCLQDLTPEALKTLEALGLDEGEAEGCGLMWDAERGCIKLPYVEEGKEINALLIHLDGSTFLASCQRVVFYGPQYDQHPV